MPILSAIRSMVFLVGCFVLASCRAPNASTSRPIADVFVDLSQIHHDAKSNGDTWDYLWADDGNLYTFGCDGRGYGRTGQNLNFNRLAGPAWNELTGSLVNPMEEYGGSGAYLADHSAKLNPRDWAKLPRGPNWKVTGADCIDGAIYAFVAENWYGNQNAYGGKTQDPFLRQTVNNMSLIKSADHGRTWIRDETANAAHPLWTNKLFSTAFFFKYGQDGGHTTQDAQDKFVYAMSNDGYWDSGSRFRLGRVARDKIGHLNAADWDYFCNGGWTGNLDESTRVPGLPDGTNLCTMGSPIWLPSLKTYVAPLWHDVGRLTSFYYPPDVMFEFWQAPHPWGPWSRIGGTSAMEFIGEPGTNRNHRWYGPSFSPKFITEHLDGSTTVILTFSGLTWEDEPNGLYKNNSCPVTFYPRPLPKLRATFNDTAARYSAGWTDQTHRGHGDWQDDIHVSTNSGSYCDFTFTGTGVEVLSEKFHDLGEIEVALDGVWQGRFQLYQDPMPRLYRIPVFRRMDLPPGPHTVRVTNCSPNGVFCLVDGFRVFGKP